MLVMGAAGLAYEYTLSKVSAELLGNTVRQWAFVIGVMMFFMGVGADLQRFFPDRRLVDIFVSLEIVQGLTGAFGPLFLLYTYGRFREYFTFFQISVVVLMGMIMGLEIPIMTRINARFRVVMKENLGSVLRMDYIGALLGSLLWIFLVPRYLTVMQIGFFLGFFTLGTAALFLLRLKSRSLIFYPLGIALISALVLTGLSFPHVKDRVLSLEQYLYRDRVIFSKTTRYQHLVLTESPRKVLRLYINGNLQFSGDDEFIYHENLVHPVMEAARSRKRILILGGGDGLALREVLKYPEVRRVTLVDIDPEMIETARTNPQLRALNHDSFRGAEMSVLPLRPGLRPGGGPSAGGAAGNSEGKPGASSRVRVFTMDAYRFLESLPGRYDAVIIDFPDPNSPELAKLYSVGFYRWLKKHLMPGALVVQQATSPLYGKEAFLAVGRSMRAAGYRTVPYHDTLPSFGEWGWWIAGDEASRPEESPEKALNRIRRFRVPLRYLTPEVFRANRVFGKGALVGRYRGITTRTNAEIYEYYKEAWKNP